MPASPIGKLPRPTLPDLRQRQQGASAYLLVVGLSLAAIAGIFVYESSRDSASESATSNEAVTEAATTETAAGDVGTTEAATPVVADASATAETPSGDAVGNHDSGGENTAAESPALEATATAEAGGTSVSAAKEAVTGANGQSMPNAAASVEVPANAETSEASAPVVTSDNTAAADAVEGGSVAQTQPPGITEPPTSPPAPPAPISDAAQSVNKAVANSAANAAEDMGEAMGFNAKARAKAENRIRAMQRHMAEMMAAHPPMPRTPSAPQANMDEPMVPPPGPAWASGMREQSANAPRFSPPQVSAPIPVAPRMQWLDVPPAMAYPAPPVELNPYLGYAPAWDGRPYFVPGYGTGYGPGYGWGW